MHDDVNTICCNSHWACLYCPCLTHASISLTATQARHSLICDIPSYHSRCEVNYKNRYASLYIYTIIQNIYIHIPNPAITCHCSTLHSAALQSMVHWLLNGTSFDDDVWLLALISRLQYCKTYFSCIWIWRFWSAEISLHFNLAFSHRVLCKVKFQVTLAMWTELCVTV